MTQHDARVCLQQMLDHAQEALDLLSGKHKNDLGSDRVLELALVRLVEIIGEAASRLAPQQQAQYPSVPWREIIGMRNRLAHGYDAIDLNVLWDTVRTDLPSLVDELKSLLK
jgi:uncharacterized protein with HEPN domain